MLKKPILNQYILIDKLLIKNIIHNLNIISNDNILEIGPGKGALTYEILKYINNISILEIDKNIIPIDILNNKNINIFIENAINFNIYKIYKINNNKKIRIIGNLPYSISIPIIINFIKYIKYIKDINIMIQKELAYKISLNNKKYCRISFLLNSFFKINIIIDNINSESFIPVPKVKSSFINMKPYIYKKKIDLEDIKFYSNLLFNKKRKKIKNILKKYININNINKNLLNNRLEKLNLNNIYKLINLIKINI